MCYVIYAKVLEVEGEDAVVDYGGVIKKFNVSLLDVARGDYVLIHEGFAIEKVDEMSAKEAIDAVKVYVNEIDRMS